MKDAYAVFAVTNYWESKDADLEMKQGKAMADAAKVSTKHSFIKYILTLNSGSWSSALCLEQSS